MSDAKKYELDKSQTAELIDISRDIGLNWLPFVCHMFIDEDKVAERMRQALHEIVAETAGIPLDTFEPGILKQNFVRTLRGFEYLGHLDTDDSSRAKYAISMQMDPLSGIEIVEKGLCDGTARVGKWSLSVVNIYNKRTELPVVLADTYIAEFPDYSSKMLPGVVFTRQAQGQLIQRLGLKD